jgi:hypothetical protein
MMLPGALVLPDERISVGHGADRQHRKIKVNHTGR